MRDPSFQRLQSERLVLRRFEARDAAALAAYRSDPEVARYQGFGACTVEEAREFIARLAGDDPGTPGAWFQFAAELASGGGLIGDCALRCGRAEPRVAELGFSFARAHQGKGYAGEALALLLDYAFGRLGLHRVYALTDARNVRARALLERTGFRREGELVEAAFAKGEWATEHLYALLEREWRAGGP